MTLAFLLFLARFAARALALVGGRRFARVAGKGTIEHQHLACVVRRLHAAGKLGAPGVAFLDTMKQLCMIVSAVAHFSDLRSHARWTGPAQTPAAMRRRAARIALAQLNASANARAHCVSPHDSS